MTDDYHAHPCAPSNTHNNGTTWADKTEREHYSLYGHEYSQVLTPTPSLFISPIPSNQQPDNNGQNNDYALANTATETRFQES